MRTLLALAAATGLGCLAQGATAAPIEVNTPVTPLVHQVDWGYYGRYCGPECQRHRYWAHRRWERSHYYGYNSPYRNRHSYYRGY